MSAHTYPDPRVARFVSEIAVPVQYNVSHDPGAQIRYHAYWTPCISLQDVEGREYRRSFGCLDVEAFLAEFALARGLRYLHSGSFGRSVELLEEALGYTERDDLRHSENRYWLAVANYRLSGNADDLEAGWVTLRAEHPESDWTRKCDFLFAD